MKPQKDPIIFHRGWSLFWNWAVDGRHKWLFKLFRNRICISFAEDEPLTAGDLWNNVNDKL